MVVYVIVGAVVLLGLVFAYRTLGGASAAAIDVDAVLRRVLAETQRSAVELDDLTAAPTLVGARATAAPNPAKVLRRRLSGLAQQLESIDVVALDERDSGAHALLSVAVDELVWAAGMCGDTFSASDGMRTAVAALHDHATLCLRDAARLVEVSATAEEVERTP